MTDYLDDVKINKMIQSYKNGQAYRNKYYNNRYKTDPVFKENRLIKSKEYYWFFYCYSSRCWITKCFIK